MKKLRLSKATRKEARAAKIFLIPAFLGLTFITYLPLLAVFALSLFNWKTIQPLSNAKFVGLSNYAKIFADGDFWKYSVWGTAKYALLTVALVMVYSMLVAILLNRKLPARGFFRAVFYIPYIIPAAALYMIWQLLYDKNFGFINALLSKANIPNIAFLQDSATIIPALAIIAVWASGNLIVILLAGLGNVPRIYHEAAEIDGANAWQRFWKITIPSMSPIIFYNLLISLVAQMQVFVPSLFYSPQNRQMYPTYKFISYNIFLEGFAGQYRMGYASAIAFIFFVIIGIMTAILFATSKTWLFYEGEDKR